MGHCDAPRSSGREFCIIRAKKKDNIPALKGHPPLTDTKAHPGRGNFVALAIVAVALAVMFVGAIMPTPLYPLYQRAFVFSGITLTLIYAVYVLGNLVALLFFGRLADQVGRRSAMLPAIAFGIASAVVFAAAPGTYGCSRRVR
jgi:fucose permease